MPIVLKSGSLNLLEPTGPVQRLLYVFVFMNNVKYLSHVQITNVTFQFIVELRVTALLFEMGMVRCDLQNMTDHKELKISQSNGDQIIKLYRDS